MLMVGASAFYFLAAASLIYPSPAEKSRAVFCVHIQFGKHGAAVKRLSNVICSSILLKKLFKLAAVVILIHK